MFSDRLPLLSDQADRLVVGDWCERHGVGVDVRTFGGGFRVTGPLDVGALRRSLTALVARHEALRAGFPDRGLAGYQVIHPPREAELVELDVRGLPPADRLAEGVDRIGGVLAGNLDPEGGLLLRAVLVRLGEQDHLLGLAADHLVVDGEAFQIVVDELWRGYQPAPGETGEEAAPPPFTYAEFVRWEADWLGHDPQPRRSIAELDGYLRGIGVNPPVRLDGALRETNERYTVGSIGGRLPTTTGEQLGAYCRKVRNTPFVVLLSAYVCALHACGSPADLGVTVPTSRRVEAHLLDLVCTLSSHATARIRLDTSVTFQDLTRQVRSEVLRAHRLGQVPAPAAVAALAPHALGRLFERPTAFFDVAPAGWSGGPRKVHELRVEPVPVPVGWQVIENLAMFASLSDREVTFTVVYPTDVFAEATVEKLVRTFTAIVEQCLNGPAVPLDELIRPFAS